MRPRSPSNWGWPTQEAGRRLFTHHIFENSRLNDQSVHSLTPVYRLFPVTASPFWHNYYLYELQFISARPFSYNWPTYRRIWIELQSRSARTPWTYGRIWIEVQFRSTRTFGKLNSHHFTFLKFQNPSSGSEVTDYPIINFPHVRWFSLVNSKYYYP